MNKEKYTEERKEMIAKIEDLIAAQKTDEANQLMAEVEVLDNKWEESKTAKANMEALKEKDGVVNLENKTEKVVDEKMVSKVEENKPMDEKEVYKVAWAKSMMNKAMTEEEQDIFNNVNQNFRNEEGNGGFTHNTTNTAVLIPETVAEGIWARAEEMYPLYADAKKYSVRGNLTIKKHVAIKAGDAAWYDEGTPTADEENEFGELELKGHELSKSVTVSWKLRSMSMEEFIPFIINELGERVGVALGKAAAQGSGSGEPEGVKTAIEAETNTPQVKTYSESDGIEYADMTAAVAKIHSSYTPDAAIYANNKTIWEQLANIVDKNNRPLFIPDVTSGGVGRMFGMVVKPDAGLPDEEVIIGAPSKGLVFNTNENFSVVTQEHAKQRETDYVAYAIVDGGVLDTKAFALLKKA